MVKSIKRCQCIRSHLKPISKKLSQYSSMDLGHRNYSRYISRIRKEVVPRRGISSHTKDIINILINDIFERIAKEACELMCRGERCTLTPADIQKAVYQLLPKRLAKFAVTFGTEAVHRFVHS
ncbi:histone H2B variant L1-like [Psammomys obesus]|uniref:histone H2B variant L1-like n=1 Tax=Psammomys obesus TaxID=48139 RepID=UPI0024534248|nr:histone H2B variant L1-like [Psammomys obesus]